jgi:hypothetical protein
MLLAFLLLLASLPLLASSLFANVLLILEVPPYPLPFQQVVLN